MSQKNIISDIQQRFRQALNTSYFPFILGGVLIIGLFWAMCFVYVRPHEYGIKQVNFGIKKGIQDRVYTAGLHFVMPFGIEEMHAFPRSIQVLDLTNSPHRSGGRSLKAAHIQTSDGFFVDVDVTILYHIVDPLKVIQTIGAGRLYEDNGVIPKTEPALKDSLGTLTTEEFYNSSLRVEKMNIARDKLNAELLEKGIEVDHVLIRYFQYSTEIQKNIEDKKLKDQLVYKNQAEARAAAEEAKLAKTVQEGEAQVKIRLEEGKAYVVKRHAERDLYVRKRRAEADLLIKLAEAKKTRLKNDALKTVGSDNLVGLEMAEALSGIDVIVLPSDGAAGINPLNLDKLIELF